MFGKTSHLTPLASRKLLLIAESNLNRAQLSKEWQTLAHGAGQLAHRAKTIAGWASSAALVGAGISAWRRDPNPPATKKSSWLPRILNAARMASTVWFAIRARKDRA